MRAHSEHPCVRFLQPAIAQTALRRHRYANNRRNKAHGRRGTVLLEIHGLNAKVEGPRNVPLQAGVTSPCGLSSRENAPFAAPMGRREETGILINWRGEHLVTFSSVGGKKADRKPKAVAPATPWWFYLPPSIASLRRPAERAGRHDARALVRHGRNAAT